MAWVHEMDSHAARAIVKTSFRDTFAKFLNIRGGRRTVSDHQVDDVQSVEQPLREGACGDSIEERLGGAGDKPDGCRGTARQFKSSEYFDQHVLNDGRHRLDVGDQ